MADQKRASEQMRDLASATVQVGKKIIQGFDALGRHDLAAALRVTVRQFEPQGEALYACMQAEEQERAEMLAILLDLAQHSDDVNVMIDARTRARDWLDAHLRWQGQD